MSYHPRIDFSKVWVGVVVLLLTSTVLAQNCASADLSLCGVGGSACEFYQWANGTCMAPTSCPTDTVWLNSTSNCLHCHAATSSQCTLCSGFNFYFNTNSNLCLKCSGSFGSACTSCSTAGCNSCSGGFSVGSDSQSCIDGSCGIAYCTACTNTTHC